MLLHSVEIKVIVREQMCPSTLRKHHFTRATKNKNIREVLQICPFICPFTSHGHFPRNNLCANTVRRTHIQSLLTTLLRPPRHLSRVKRVCNTDGNYFQTSGALAVGAI